MAAAELRSAGQPGAAVPHVRTKARSFLSIDTKSPVQIASDWEVHSHQDKELVKGLGLTSATMLVMGSMIGSGIFIVSAEIAREVDSPALLIGAWAVAGFVTIAAVGVAFGKFLGVFFPAISSSNWILHLWKVPPIHVGPMVLGNMDVGINTQNLVAILLVVFLSIVNIFGLKTGAIIQNVFTFAKVSALLGLV